MSQNDIEDLPDGIGKENQLECIPEEISGLQNLTDLILSQNDIEDLPDGIGKENQLECIPEEISGLQNLTDLILSQNDIEDLPDGIGKDREPVRVYPRGDQRPAEPNGPYIVTERYRGSPRWYR